MPDNLINTAMIAKGLTSPRLTPDGLRSLIVKEDYMIYKDTTLTVCFLTLKNGTILVGYDACCSKENFDKAIGELAAYEAAFRQLWALEGYLLKETLHLVEQKHSIEYSLELEQYHE